ncbi:hypothetical protein E0H73_09270 [Kribbella pittospori]|uniref:Uncharacterized protein n=1 Tax=Kribbella pittospori TaxID=722689 RepID=A0A4R0KXU3_9ACTN|nr:hypothetical protein [Kribbella pittospori]TCC64564.1 hypothetical protein E0H73_09270 [Kribbella pittospori]
MRVLGKVLLVLVAVVGVVGLAFGGFMAALWGFADQYAAHYDYKVGFKDPGDECGNNELSVDRADGAPLACGYGGSSGKLPGFSDEQNAEVIALSRELGAGGFTDAERDQLQRRVDRIVASLPADRLPQHAWLWGWQLGVLGLLSLVVPITVVRTATRRIRR